MFLHHLSHDFQSTRFVRIETHLCKGCWKCWDVCPSGVLDKVRMPFHKHIVIAQPDNCRGCRKCVKVCPRSAIEPLVYEKTLPEKR